MIISVLSIICTPATAPVHFHSNDKKCYKYFLKISEKYDINNEKQHHINKFIKNKDEAFGYIKNNHKFIEISRNTSIDTSGGLLLYIVHGARGDDYTNINDIIKLYQETEKYLKLEFGKYFNLNKECIIIFKSIDGTHDITINDNECNPKALNYDTNRIYDTITTHDFGEEKEYKQFENIELTKIKQKQKQNKESFIDLF